MVPPTTSPPPFSPQFGHLLFLTHQPTYTNQGKWGKMLCHLLHTWVLLWLTGREYNYPSQPESTGNFALFVPSHRWLWHHQDTNLWSPQSPNHKAHVCLVIKMLNFKYVLDKWTKSRFPPPLSISFNINFFLTKRYIGMNFYHISANRVGSFVFTNPKTEFNSHQFYVCGSFSTQ